MLWRIVTIIFPLFAIVVAGYVYGRIRRPDMSFANQLTMEVFAPALVFAALADKSFDLGTYWILAIAAAAVALAPGLLALPITRWIGVEPKTFVPPMMFYNSGNMGLPLAVLAFGDGALAPAVILFLVTNVLHFSFGAWLLDHDTRIATLWRVPVVAAAIAGLAVSLLGIEVWPPLLGAIRMVGEICIPLLVFALGVRLTDASIRSWNVGLIGAAARPLLGLLVAWPLARWLDLPPPQSALLILAGALPPAVLNYVFAERYRQEPDKVASIVLLGNIGAVIFIPLALAIALPKS